MRTPVRSILLSVLFACLAAASAAGQPPAPPSDARFVASSRGEVYYWIGCEAWRRLSRANLRYFRSAAEAEAAGYRPSQSRGCAPQLETDPIRPSINGSADCTVSRIIDGDTFQCEGGSRVRLLLVDAQEAGQGMWADSAALLLQWTMPPGTVVRLEFDVGLFDRYRRVLAYVHADTLFINRALVRRGLALVSVFQPNVARLDVIRAAADSARDERIGLWSGSPIDTGIVR